MKRLTNRLTALLALLCFVAVAIPARATTTATAKSSDTLIRNATVLTITNGTLKDTDILVQNGKIAKIGKDLKAPEGAKVIDATGKFVLPGIIDCHSHTMIDAVNEGSVSVTSMCRIQDVLNPTDPALYLELAGGVTALNLLHGSANAIGGQNSVVKIKYGRPVGEFPFPDAPPGIKFALGENPKRSNFRGIPGLPNRYPTTRMGVEEVIRDAFTRARDYKRQWDAYNAAKAKGDNVFPPRRDLQLEPLVEVLEGKRYVHSHCYRAEEILMLIGIADDFGFKIRTFQHTLEGYKVAKEIAKHGAGASIFADFWAYKVEAYDAIPYDGAILERAGVLVSLNSDDDGRARRLNVEAAKMMKYGDVSEENALRMITINPAKQLGIDRHVGSIEVGKDADFAIWTAHPLSVYARVEMTFVDGDVFFDRSTDLANREARAKERAELEKADPNRAGEGGQPGGIPRGRRPAYKGQDNCLKGAEEQQQ